MKTVHSKKNQIEANKTIPLHFKIEINETKANVVLEGKVSETVSGICSAMEQIPDLASLIMEAAFMYGSSKKNNNPKL